MGSRQGNRDTHSRWRLARELAGVEEGQHYGRILQSPGLSSTLEVSCCFVQTSVHVPVNCSAA